MTPLFLTHCKSAGKVYRAINNKTRQKIIALLKESDKNVTELYVTLRTEQSIVSQHLGTMLRAKIVTKTRFGKYSIYSLNEKGIKAISAANAALGFI